MRVCCIGPDAEAAPVTVMETLTQRKRFFQRKTICAGAFAVLCVALLAGTQVQTASAQITRVTAVSATGVSPKHKQAAPAADAPITTAAAPAIGAGVAAAPPNSSAAVPPAHVPARSAS